MNEDKTEVYTDLEQEAATKKSPFESEMEKLEMEYQKGSLVAAILEVRLRIRELTEKLEGKTTKDQEGPIRSIKR